jgi:hypothetical protein
MLRSHAGKVDRFKSDDPKVFIHETGSRVPNCRQRRVNRGQSVANGFRQKNLD